jgi:hypothetical protein
MTIFDKDFDNISDETLPQKSYDSIDQAIMDYVNEEECRRVVEEWESIRMRHRESGIFAIDTARHAIIDRVRSL